MPAKRKAAFPPDPPPSPDCPEEKGEVDLTAFSVKKQKGGDGDDPKRSLTLARDFIAWIDEKKFDYSKSVEDEWYGWNNQKLISTHLEILDGFADIAKAYGYREPKYGEGTRVTRNFEEDSHQDRPLQFLTDPLMRTLQQVGSGEYKSVLSSDIDLLKEVVGEYNYHWRNKDNITKIWKGRRYKFLNEFLNEKVEGGEEVRVRMYELASINPRTHSKYAFEPITAVVGAARAFLCAADGHVDQMLELIEKMTKEKVKKADTESFREEAMCRVCRRRVRSKYLGRVDRHV